MRRPIALNTLFPALCLALSLSGCGDDARQGEPAPEMDPALSGALGGQIMVDPDLVGQNQANAVASLPSQDGSLPTLDIGAEAIATARAEALRQVGGPGSLRKAPEAREVAGSLPPDAALTAAARAAAGGQADCAARARYTMQWAARMPEAFPVYPHGAVQEAAGTDAEGCALRVVNFRTPVPLGEVMDFYYTRARAAGFTAQRVLQDGDDVLGGAKGKASYIVYARRLPTGVTEVDLVTSG